MNNRVSALFTIKSWDEKPSVEGEGLPKITRASVSRSYSGEIEGEGRVEYVMMYRSDGTAAFLGIERISGRLGGRSGSFALQRTGEFEGGQAKESYSVIPGSGTGELSGIRGEGSSSLGHANEYPFDLDYELE
jgi:hypothetical protein